MSEVLSTAAHLLHPITGVACPMHCGEAVVLPDAALCCPIAWLQHPPGRAPHEFQGPFRLGRQTAPAPACLEGRPHAPPPLQAPQAPLAQPACPAQSAQSEAQVHRLGGSGCEHGMLACLHQAGLPESAPLRLNLHALLKYCCLPSDICAFVLCLAPQVPRATQVRCTGCFCRCHGYRFWMLSAVQSSSR